MKYQQGGNYPKWRIITVSWREGRKRREREREFIINGIQETMAEQCVHKCACAKNSQSLPVSVERAKFSDSKRGHSPADCTPIGSDK